MNERAYVAFGLTACIMKKADYGQGCGVKPSQEHGEERDPLGTGRCQISGKILTT